MDPEQIRRLVSASEPEMAAAFLAVIAGIKNARTLGQVVDLLSAGRIDDALAVVGQHAQKLVDPWLESFTRAARKTSTALESLGLGQVVIRYDQTNLAAVNTMRENTLRLVREFTQAQREATRAALIEGVRLGENPIQQARRFRDSIGLTARQEAAVANYERLLREGDPDALSRRLRDRRFDRTARRAMAAGEPIPEAQIQRMVKRYRERAIKHRAQIIARTEALRSVHEGQHAMMMQAAQTGVIDPASIVREWNTAADERVRTYENTGGKTSHASMHGQQTSLDGVFVSGAGNALRFPADPQAPGYDTIACRCVVAERVNIQAGGVFGAQLIEVTR